MLKGLRRRRKNELELSSGVTNIVVGTDDVVKPLLFDSVNFKFQVPIFFKELILHLCYPFGLLLFGKPCHMFNKFVVPNIIFGHFLPFCTIISLIAAYFTKFDLQGGELMGLLLVVVHRSMISLKYATMSRSEYRRLQSTPSGEVLDEFQKQIHLFSGWDISNSAVIEFEVAAAAARTGVVLPHLKLYLPACNKSVLNAQVSRWHRFLKICGRNVQREPDTGAYYVCVRDVCTALPAWAYHHMTKLMKFGTFFAAFNALLLATIPFMRTAGFKDMDPWAVIYFCTSTPVTFCFGFVILNFLNLALLSVFRQLDIAYSLNEMISLSDIYLTANLRFADASHVSFANKYSTLNGDAVYDNGKLRYFDDELDAKHVGRILGQDITGGNGVDDTRKAEVDDVIVGSNRYEDCRSAKPQNIVPKEIKPEDRCPSSALYRSQPEFDPNTSNSVELMQLLYKKHQALGVEGHEMGTDYEDISDFDWLRDTMGGVDDTILESPTNADENLEEVEFFPADKTFSLHAFDKVIEVEDSSIKDSESDKMHRKLKINPSPRKRAKYKWKEKDDFESATSVANSIAHEIESVIPRVSVQYASNIYSWLYTRNVMHNYGTRFRFRVDCFIGVITLILFFLMMLVTVEIVLTTQDERYNVLMGTVVLQCLLSVVITTFYSIVFISAGAYVNDYYQDHRHTVVSLLVFCRKGIDELKNHVELLNKVAAVKKKDACDLEDYEKQAHDNQLQIEVMEGVAESLDTAKDSIELMNIQEPVRVLGIDSQFSLAFSIFTTVVSFLLYVATLVFGTAAE